MTTFNNWDFTNACCRVFRRYYPDVRIILADGGSTDLTTTDYKDCADDIVIIKDGIIEDCRNAASVLVDTEYLLTMDNDSKVTGEEALPLLLEVAESNWNIGEVGAYCVKVTNFKEKFGYCSRVFTKPMEVDWCPAYFTLHRTQAWKDVHGMPKEWYYGNPPFQRSEESKRYNNGGDASISKYYQKEGWKIYSPRKEVPVLHFVGAAWWSTGMKTADWWLNKHTHIPIKPLNDWEACEQSQNAG